jgi:hypothetical protein
MRAASVILYECCVAAGTVLGMSQVVGNLGTRFRVMEEARSAVHNRRGAPAEADVRRFWRFEAVE